MNSSEEVFDLSNLVNAKIHRFRRTTLMIRSVNLDKFLLDDKSFVLMVGVSDTTFNKQIQMYMRSQTISNFFDCRISLYKKKGSINLKELLQDKLVTFEGRFFYCKCFTVSVLFQEI